MYSAHKALGGGVTIDLIHEWDYLVDLFGVPETICNIRGKYSDLEIDSDDLSIYIAQYPTLLAEVHLITLAAPTAAPLSCSARMAAAWRILAPER